MKNKRIIDSWNRIEPDSAVDQRMLSVIIARSHSGQSEKEKVYNMNKIFKCKRLAPLAACLVLFVALVAVVGNNAGWFGGKTLVADLGGSGTLHFYEGKNVDAGSFAWDEDWGDEIARDLTAAESKVLFCDLGVTGYAVFRSTDNALMHFEGKIGKTAGITVGETKIILSDNGFPLTDTVLEGNEEVSEINGIPVAAGHFVTDANSKGEESIIYFASFDTASTSVYIELGGSEAYSDALRAEIGNVINELTENPPDISAISAE